MNIKINKLYTKSGDEGLTYLANGKKTKKYSLRVTAYGEVDELNSTLALVIAEDLKNLFTNNILNIQSFLFDIGGELATPDKPIENCVIEKTDIEELEKLIDENILNLPELRSFVIPGGSKLNSVLHLSRTVCRRAERSLWKLMEEEKINSNLMIYLNRLSDYLFGCCRTEAYNSNRAEMLWIKKEGRVKKEKQ